MAFENLKSTGIAYVLTKLKDYFLQIKDAVKTVNGNEPDENGEITLDSIPYAQNLESDSSSRSNEKYIQRMAGGDGSINDGNAWLMSIKGNNTHTGHVNESIAWECSDDDLTVTFNRATFVAYVNSSQTITLTYTSSWSADPSLYGFTVTGTPQNGDTITVVYVKEVPGTITVATPESFIATGWNLYDHSTGMAKVVKYDGRYKISGSYTTIKYSATESGSQTTVDVTDGFFDIPADGYIHLTGGNNTNTAIFATWGDWESGYKGSFQAYTETEIDFSDFIGENNVFPYGLLKAGTAVDEIDLDLGRAINRVERLANTAENMEDAVESGLQYEYDGNYIYLELESEIVTTITINGAYTVSDHGIEYFTGTSVDVDSETLYGSNLKNKLERDVLTISQQSLTAAQQAQVQDNIGVPSNDELGDVHDLAEWKIDDLIYLPFALVGWAHNSSEARFFIKTEKVFPETGIKLKSEFTVTGIYKADGTSVSVEGASVAVSRASQCLYIRITGLTGLTQNSITLLKMSTTTGVTRQVRVEAA